MQKTKLEIPVFGMKCSKCVARVTDIICAFSQVEDVDVSLEEKSAEILFYPSKQHHIEDIKKALIAAGFRVDKTEEK